MTNSTTDDYYPIHFIQYWFPWVLTEISCLTGLLIQSFIVAVNGLDWLQRRSITDVDKIVISLGISRIFFHTAIQMHLTSWFCFPTHPGIFSIFYTLMGNTSDFSSIWLSMLLSTYFYLKISTSRNVIFLHLNTFISRGIVYLIIAPVLLFAVYTSVYYLRSPITIFFNSTNHYISYIKAQEHINSYVVILWNIASIVILLIVSFPLIVLLGFHTCKMRNGGDRTCRTDTYHRTMRFTVASFLSCAFFILVKLLQMNMGILEFVWFFLLVNFFPVQHSILLIYATKKLRNQFFAIVHCKAVCLLNRKDPEPRSRVQ